MKTDPLVLVDGNNQIFSSEWGTGLYYKNKRVSGVLTLLYRLRKWVKEYSDSSNIIVCWDTFPEQKHKIYKEYKADRRELRTSLYHDIMSQIPILEKMFNSLGIKHYKVKGYEADQLIADITQCTNGKKIIVSTDSDFLPLLSESITVLNGKKLFTVRDLQKKYNMNPEEFFFYKVVCGDKTDNVPGIRGIGRMRYLKILEECDYNLERLLQHYKVSPYLDLVERNYQIIKLNKLNLEQTRSIIVRRTYPNIDKFRELCYEYGIWSIIKGFQGYVKYFRRKRNPRKD